MSRSPLVELVEVAAQIRLIELVEITHIRCDRGGGFKATLGQWCGSEWSCFIGGLDKLDQPDPSSTSRTPARPAESGSTRSGGLDKLDQRGGLDKLDQRYGVQSVSIRASSRVASCWASPVERSSPRSRLMLTVVSYTAPSSSIT